MKIEKRIEEALQSKSHQFLIGRTTLEVSFDKEETGTIRNVLIVEKGAKSLGREDKSGEVLESIITATRKAGGGDVKP